MEPNTKALQVEHEIFLLQCMVMRGHSKLLVVKSGKQWGASLIRVCLASCWKLLHFWQRHDVLCGMPERVREPLTAFEPGIGSCKPVNEEFPISSSDQLTLIKFLAFVHPTSHYFQPKGRARCSHLGPCLAWPCPG